MSAVWRRRTSPLIYLTLVLSLALGSSTWAMAHHQRLASRSDASEATPVLGILVDRDLRVVSVDWWSSARRSGIQPGDVLRKIGSVALPPSIAIDTPDTPIPITAPPSIRGTADLKSVFRSLVPGWEHTVTIEVDRQGQVRDIPVLVTAKPFDYDPTNPPPTVTPVPASLDTSMFYL